MTALFVCCFALYFPHEPVGFYSDSLHLLRLYSSSELLQTWKGNWDPDGIENAGYRPLGTLFAHVSCLLFGESALAHRFALMLLWCLTSAYIVLLLRLFQVPALVSLLACWIWMSTPINAYYVAWLAAGIHIFQVALVIPAGILWVLAERETSAIRKRRLFLGGVFLSISAILTREDSLSMIAVISGLPALDAFISGAKWPHVLKKFYIYAVSLIFMASLFFAVRHCALRGIPNRFAIYPGQLYGEIRWLLPDFFTFSLLTKNLGIFFFWLLAFALIVNRSRKSLWISLFLIISLAVSLMHTVLVKRVDLLIFPSLILSLCIALGLWRAFYWNRIIFALCAVCFTITSFFAVGANQQEQSQFLPYSLETLRYDIGFLYGEYAGRGKPTIPIERQVVILKKLHSLGLDHLPTLRRDFNRLADRCQAEQQGQIGEVHCIPGIRLPENFEMIPQFTNQTFQASREPA
jgi:hypothetical protein